MRFTALAKFHPAIQGSWALSRLQETFAGWLLEGPAERQPVASPIHSVSCMLLG